MDVLIQLHPAAQVALILAVAWVIVTFITHF